MSAPRQQGSAAAKAPGAWEQLRIATVSLIASAREFQAAILAVSVRVTIEGVLAQCNIPVRSSPSSTPWPEYLFQPLAPPPPAETPDSVERWAEMRRATRRLVNDAQAYYDANQDTMLGASIEDTLGAAGITVGRFYLPLPPSTTPHVLPPALQQAGTASRPPLLPPSLQQAGTASRPPPPSTPLSPLANLPRALPLSRAPLVSAGPASSAASTSASRLPAPPPQPLPSYAPAAGEPSAPPPPPTAAEAAAYYESLHETMAPARPHPSKDASGKPQCQKCEAAESKGPSWRYWYPKTKPKGGRLCNNCYATHYQAIKRAKRAYAEQHGLVNPDQDGEGDGGHPQPTLALASSPQPTQPTGVEGALTGLFQVDDPLQDLGDDEGGAVGVGNFSAFPSLASTSVQQMVGSPSMGGSPSPPATQEPMTSGSGSHQGAGDDDVREEEEEEEEETAPTPPRKRKKAALTASGGPSTRRSKRDRDPDDPGNSPASSSAGVSTRGAKPRV